MSFYAEYINYFLGIATKSTEIVHTADDCHFTPISLDDFNNGIISKIKFKHLLLLRPDYVLGNDRSGNLVKKYVGQLMLLDRISEKNTTTAQKNAIINSMEALNDEIIARILNDTYKHGDAGAGLFYATPEQSNMVGYPVGANDVNQKFFGAAGWFLQFEINWPVSATADKTKWTDPENLEDEE